MIVARTIKTALQALRQNALRAALTILGIVIGIAAVIAMVEIGNGSSNSIRQTMESMGANSILVLPGSAASGGISFGAGTNLTLTIDDYEALAKQGNYLRSVAPIVRVRAQLIYENKNWTPQTIQGTTASFLDVRDWNTLSEGRMFDDADIRNGNKVCVIGQTLVRELFDGLSPVGREVRVKNVSLKVIGVLSAKGANMMGHDQDDILLAPWTTIKYRISGTSASAPTTTTTTTTSSTDSNAFYPPTSTALYPGVSEGQARNSSLPIRFANIDQILTAAKSPEAIPLAINEMTTLLRERHRLRDGEPDDFNIRNMAEMTKALSATSNVMTNLLLCVSMISLLVGGVGIMNIMLVSVTERTREIGLRMALGARERDIRSQFLVEAIVLCLIGGVLGVVLGRMSSSLVTLLLGWPTQLSLAAIIGAVGVSVTVGLVFGYYPARKASTLDPIEALRYE